MARSFYVHSVTAGLICRFFWGNGFNRSPAVPKICVTKEDAVIRKRRILKEEFRLGAEIFWFEPYQSNDQEFNANYVRVFAKETEKYSFLMTHISNIIPVLGEVPSEPRWGKYYPTMQWFRSVKA